MFVFNLFMLKIHDSMKGYGFYLYKTTNTVNGKYYYGVHTYNPKQKYDYYLGSGAALKASIKKYGRNSFIREILEWFDTEEEAYKREAEIVTETLVSDPMCYNLKLGGKGGMRGRKMPEEEKQRISKKLKGRKLSPETIEKLVKQNKGRKRTPEQNRRNSESHKGRKPTEATREKLRKSHSHPRADWIKKRISEGKLGHSVSEEVREKISKSSKGKVYVTDGNVTKRVEKFELDAYLDRGWVRGRKKS